MYDQFALSGGGGRSARPIWDLHEKSKLLSSLLAPITPFEHSSAQRTETIALTRAQQVTLTAALWNSATLVD
jgi:hypothetical protein